MYSCMISSYFCTHFTENVLNHGTVQGWRAVPEAEGKDLLQGRGNGVYSNSLALEGIAVYAAL